MQSEPSAARSKISYRAVLLLIVAAGVAVKWSVWQLPPQVFNDTPGYMVPALSLLDGRGYGSQQNGFRTPTYPLFLAAVLAPLDRAPFSECHDARRAVCIGRGENTPAGMFDLRMVVAVQAILGLLITALLFHLGVHLTRSLLVGALIAAGYALNLSTAFWELSILTETLTTLLVMLSVFLTIRARPGDRLLPLLLGLVLGALALCHSLFLLYWILPVAYLAVRSYRSGWRSALAQAAPVALIPVAFLLVWSAYNYGVNGSFTASTLTGQLVFRMASPAVEYAPEQYRQVANIYIRYRDQRLKETGSDADAIFRAVPEMMSAQGITWTELSQQLTGLGVYLIVNHPEGYLSSVRRAWDKFWDFAFYHYDPVPDGPARWMLWFTNLDLQKGLTIAFWLTPLALALLWQRRRTDTQIPFAPLVFVMGTVWFAALMVAFTNIGDNARYRSYVLPLQYGTLVFVVWSVVQTVWARASTNHSGENRDDQPRQAREHVSGAGEN